MTKEDKIASFAKVKRLVDAKGTSYNEICKALELPQSIFSEWKKGKSMPKADKLVKIADYFGVTVDYFVN